MSCYDIFRLVSTSLEYMYCFFFFKQKTAYDMRISDWSSDVCSSDLATGRVRQGQLALGLGVGTEGSGEGFADRADFEQRLIGHCQIGRASCRERVCQYV